MPSPSLAPRFPLDFYVTIVAGKKRIRAKSRNLSVTGLGLELPAKTKLGLGATVTLELHFAEAADAAGDSPIPSPGLKKTGPLRLKASVIWQTGNRCGFEIKQIGKDARRVYESLVSGYETLLKMSEI